jgi:hypothetical protein
MFSIKRPAKMKQPLCHPGTLQGVMIGTVAPTTTAAIADSFPSTASGRMCVLPLLARGRTEAGEAGKSSTSILSKLITIFYKFRSDMGISNSRSHTPSSIRSSGRQEEVIVDVEISGSVHLGLLWER